MGAAPAHAKRPVRSRQDSFIEVRQILVVAIFCLSLVGLIAFPIPSGAPANYPSWWFSRGVIVQSNPTNASPAWPTNYPTSDDYAVINQGQLKNIATQAYNELQSSAPTNVWDTSAGSNLTAFVSGLSTTTTNTDNYAVANLGQLKTVAQPFYSVLAEIGYTSQVPWTGTGADDYSTANLGQVKNVFAFDVGAGTSTNGVPNWWEQEYFGATDLSSSSDSDGNGETLLQDFQQGNNPTNYYSQNGTIVTPTLAIVSGNNQSALPGTILSNSLVVKVTDASGNPMTNAPVTFAVTAGGGTITPDSSLTDAATTQLVQTASDGTAQVEFIEPYVNSGPSTIMAQTGGQTVSFNATMTIFNPVLAGGGDEFLAISDAGAVRILQEDGTYTCLGSPDNVVSAAVGDGLGGSNATFNVVAGSDGHAWAWGAAGSSGNNSNGQLGNGTTTDSTSPVEVITAPSTPLTNVQAVAAGSEHALALTQDGSVYAWGCNGDGQLGNNGNTDSDVAIKVSGLPQIVAISARYNSSYALDINGNVWSWGMNGFYELGYNTGGSDQLTPAQVTGLPKITALAAGTLVVTALASNGTVWTWGDNEYGELGDTTDSDHGDSTTGPYNVSIPDSGATVTAISAGEGSCYAVMSDGTVYAWGYNADGELGNGNEIQQDSPVQVTAFTNPSGTVRITSVAATLDEAAVMGSDGSVWMWGDDTQTPQMVPLNLIPSATDTNGNGIPDSWELSYYGTLVSNPYATTYTGLTIIQAYQEGVSPVPPAISITSGQNQTAPQATYLSSPIVANVSAVGGGAIANVPVTFTNSGSYIGYFATSIGGSASPSITVNTDASGNATVYYAGPDTPGVTNTVQATFGSNTATASELTTASPGDVAPPSGLVATASGSGQKTLNWSNNATNATYILVQESIDAINYFTIDSISPTNTTYPVSGLNPNGTYTFGVIAGHP